MSTTEEEIAKFRNSGALSEHRSYAMNNPIRTRRINTREEISSFAETMQKAEIAKLLLDRLELTGKYRRNQYESYMKNNNKYDMADIYLGFLKNGKLESEG